MWFPLQPWLSTSDLLVCLCPCSNDIDIEEQLQSLKTSISLLSKTTGNMCTSLRKLGEVYSTTAPPVTLCAYPVAKLLGKGKQWSKSLSNRLSCLISNNAIQESFYELKETILDMQFVLKRGDHTAVQTKIQSYTRVAKKAQKQFRKNRKKSTAADQQSCRVIKMLS